MGKVGTFIFGFLLGGVFVFSTLHYHLIRAEDGMHVVAKTTSTFSETYVDIRSFGPDEWYGHRQVAEAIHQAGKTELLQGFVTNPIQNAVGGAIQSVNGAVQSAGFPFDQGASR